MFSKKISGAFQIGLGILVLVLVAFDQYLKWWTYNKGGFFNWRNYFDIGFYENYGTAFGIPIPYFVLFPLIFVCLAFIAIRYWRYVWNKYLWANIAVFMIIGGAISNFIDRINYGFVIDYLHFFFGSTFNIADCLIIGGVAIIIIKEFKK